MALALFLIIVAAQDRSTNGKSSKSVGVWYDALLPSCPKVLAPHPHILPFASTKIE